MRRITKKLLTFLLGILFTALYCEFLIYYIVIAQCSWPVLEGTNVLKALVIADTHLLGPHRGHWLDKLRREWQMRQSFQAIINIHRPEAVFVLGDLFDEGEWSNTTQFDDYVDRFYRYFSVPQGTKMYAVAGNHDIGFHNHIRKGSAERFMAKLRSPSVRHFVIKGNHFVLINSMAMEGDTCALCIAARNSIEKISDKLNCTKNPDLCPNFVQKWNYSRPILMQHFPLYRISDATCTEPDAPPLPERSKKFRHKIDSLSQEATDYLVTKIRPRAAFGGHTHHGCLVEHSYEIPEKTDFYEYSVPSFSWRNRPDPKYMLVAITPDQYEINKCGLPKEITIAVSAVVLMFLVIVYTVKRRSIGRG